ncbi:transposase family protein [Streptomyces coffeae]|uniref:transposase family protein n=1 Tax=Streptomyces coffeae TaxID=621382 RepID=UPI001F28FCC2|nr:transposase family protein [Streptomyces coffeae]
MAVPLPFLTLLPSPVTVSSKGALGLLKVTQVGHSAGAASPEHAPVRPARSGVSSATAARPGRAGEIITARHNEIAERLRAAGLGAIGDLGLIGLGTDPGDPVVITGFKAARAKPLTAAKKQANKLITAERAACEHAFAHLKNWRILTKLRLSAHHATTLLRAPLVLNQHRDRPVTDDLHRRHRPPPARALPHRLTPAP